MTYRENNGIKSGKNSDRARPFLWSTTKQQLEASDWLLLLWGKYSDLENCASADFFVTKQWTVHGCGVKYLVEKKMLEED